MSLLEVQNLNVHFKTYTGQVHVVRDFGFQLEAGQTLGIVGESGCGKSVSSMALMGLLPNSAQVKFDSVKLEGQSVDINGPRDLHQIRGTQIAMIFQDPMSSLNPALTVGYQLAEACQQRVNAMPASSERSNEGANQDASIDQTCLDLMTKVGIPDPHIRMNAYPHQLSGGMCQRIMIAMALAMKPKVLIADEPTTALDVTIQAQILSLLKDLQKEYSMGLILITHDIGVVESMSDQLVVMYAGEMVEQGNTFEVVNRAAHPYTRALMQALPSHHEAKEKLRSIPGIVPDLKERPSGCQFYERCEESRPECASRVIGVQDIRESKVRCDFPLTGGVS